MNSMNAGAAGAGAPPDFGDLNDDALGDDDLPDLEGDDGKVDADEEKKEKKEEAEEEKKWEQQKNKNTIKKFLRTEIRLWKKKARTLTSQRILIFTF